ncbi:MAG: polymerase sigma-70 factor, subfamily [Pseudonocardiales bacterium]|nr:polymerase sigma-70 factor, subfamily [Pseudonocardiales bacterium]
MTDENGGADPDEFRGGSDGVRRRADEVRGGSDGVRRGADEVRAGADPDDVRRALNEAHRRDWACVLAATVRSAGSLDLAEECTQDAFMTALQTWPRDGIPRSPAAWLITTARRRAIDVHRRDQTLRAKLPLLVEPDEHMAESPAEVSAIGDERLRLIFTCCHPALAREAQVALTLRLLCGLTTAEIARAFLVGEPTMAARVTRAKKKIAAARIPYRVPAEQELPDRLDAVLTVLHLLFTTGHAAPTGDALVRDDLVVRAIELGRLVVRLMPDEREAIGLLALMVVTDARRATRTDAEGAVLLLAEQDRGRWDHAAIAEAHSLILSALRGGRPGRFVLQAAIAALHAEAPSYADTDWRQIVGLYDLLLAAWPSPVVAMNRAVAVSMADGPQAGLELLTEIESASSQLLGYHYLHAVRADLLRQLGRRDEAATAYRQAIELCSNSAERQFLSGRLSALRAAPDPK